MHTSDNKRTIDLPEGWLLADMQYPHRSVREALTIVEDLEVGGLNLHQRRQAVVSFADQLERRLLLRTAPDETVMFEIDLDGFPLRNRMSFSECPNTREILEAAWDLITKCTDEVANFSTMWAAHSLQILPPPSDDGNDTVRIECTRIE